MTDLIVMKMTHSCIERVRGGWWTEDTFSTPGKRLVGRILYQAIKLMALIGEGKEMVVKNDRT